MPPTAALASPAELSPSLPDPHPTAPVQVPELPEVVAGGLGLAVFGFCIGLGTADPATAFRAIPATLGIAAGPFLLTTPALLVVHQLARLASPPEAVVAATASALVAAGRLALGLAPTALFFAATSDLALPVFILAGLAIGTLAVLRTTYALVQAERAATERFTDTALMQLVALGWAALTALIGIRIAFDATVWTFHG